MHSGVMLSESLPQKTHTGTKYGSDLETAENMQWSGIGWLQGKHMIEFKGNWEGQRRGITVNVRRGDSWPTAGWPYCSFRSAGGVINCGGGKVDKQGR